MTGIPRLKNEFFVEIISTNLLTLTHRQVFQRQSSTLGQIKAGKKSQKLTSKSRHSILME